MREINSKVEYIGKPETIENIRSKPDSKMLDPIDWDEDSDNRIQKYLIDCTADGGVVISSDYRERSSSGSTWVEGHITIQPYILI